MLFHFFCIWRGSISLFVFFELLYLACMHRVRAVFSIQHITWDVFFCFFLYIGSGIQKDFSFLILCVALRCRWWVPTVGDGVMARHSTGSTGAYRR